MGFNTVAVLYNDMTSEIEGSSNLGKRIATAMRNWSMRDRRLLSCWFGAGEVISQDHADGYQVTVVHANSGWRIGTDDAVPEDVLRNVAHALERHGYKVRKPKMEPV